MINAEMQAKLRRSLIEHEAYRKFPYSDSVGKITIGIGYNLTDRGIDDDWINSQFMKDVNFFYTQLTNDFRWFTDLDVDRQIVLIDMAFMGYRKLLTFKKMFLALADQDYQRAAFEMINSTWATQVKNRATTLSHAMLTGVYTI